MDDEEEQAAALEKATATYTEHARQFRDFERVRLQLHTPSPLIDTDPVSPSIKALADERIVSTLIRYLGRYREFNDAKKLKRLVSLMHRIVVSVGADAFFYKVRTSALSVRRLAVVTSILV
jgi:replication fork protection complex subunit Tof1/Swi1